MLSIVYGWRNRVLDNARLADGEKLLDVGAGDGLIAFSALDRIGQHGKVIFSDISQDLLDHCRQLAEQMNVLDRCEFVQAAADDLSVIPDASIDVVTTRSVLIYVKAKQKAFDEFYRVLTPGGRASIFEPINRFSQNASPDLLWGYDITPVTHIASKVRAVYERIQPIDDPMLDFDERDLIDHAERAGFQEVHLQLEADVTPTQESDWETMIRRAANPLVPTLEEAIAQALTREESEQFISHLRPLVEGRKGTRRSAVALLWAVK
jgi:ubiquinone/menaquinone biosynthesis C-methylase UbiE